VVNFTGLVGQFYPQACPLFIQCSVITPAIALAGGLNYASYPQQALIITVFYPIL